MGYWRDLQKAEDVIGQLRQIIQRGMNQEEGYRTDREIYGKMHMAVLRLLECDPQPATMFLEASHEEVAEATERALDWDGYEHS